MQTKFNFWNRVAKSHFSSFYFQTVLLIVSLQLLNRTDVFGMNTDTYYVNEEKNAICAKFN